MTHRTFPVATTPPPQAPREAEPLRAHVPAAAEEVVQEIRRLVPEYAAPPGGRFDRAMRWAVVQSVEHFVEVLAGAPPDGAALTGLYAGIGAYEARRGRSLDGLQTAIRVGGQVACRRFIDETRRLDWSLETLGQITEALFEFLEQVAGAASRGYAEATQRLATERERLRWRLRDLLIADPPASRGAIAELARPAGWSLPRTIAAVAVRPPAGRPVPVLPPAILADWDRDDPYLLVPDPDGPGQEGFLATLLGGCRAAIGPTVPPDGGALSLRWARRTLALTGRDGPARRDVIRCLDNVPAVAASMSRELLALAVGERLRPLDELPPHRRVLFARTLLEYMKCHDNAVDAAERLMVHDQTVRYRIRRLRRLLGDGMNDPLRRTELMLLLHAAVEFGLIEEDAAETAAAAPHARPEPHPVERGTA
ncbi:helix-turn-helix domain-containing protein [Spirillospora sp. NPDC029432]|uniref:helix-turn-helix domain-containing protein n=1 Tax=Spirillospora sp. NPDC029432 TaxID=3154599 RepID=UPI003454DCD1